LAALVTTAGSVDRLCLPHFDSPSVLARLLDNEAGHFLIAPVGAASPTRRYYRQSGLVLETVWQTGDGTLLVTDQWHSHGTTKATAWAARRPVCSCDVPAAPAARSRYTSSTPHARNSARSTPI
jgi:GH15 family glucan-1,4-alpha-glucosidase